MCILIDHEISGTKSCVTVWIFSPRADRIAVDRSQSGTQRISLEHDLTEAIGNLGIKYDV